MPQAAWLYARLPRLAHKQKPSGVSMPQAAMLYARPSVTMTSSMRWCFNAASGNAIRATCAQKIPGVSEFSSFNAASGNAIRATLNYFIDQVVAEVSMPQAAMLYARLASDGGKGNPSLRFNAASGNAIRATLQNQRAHSVGIRVSMPQAAMLYARPWMLAAKIILFTRFNAASGNAIRATQMDMEFSRNLYVFQCRKRQCYTRDNLSWSSSMQHTIVSMPQAAMLYARLCLSRPA